MSALNLCSRCKKQNNTDTRLCEPCKEYFCQKRLRINERLAELKQIQEAKDNIIWRPVDGYNNYFVSNDGRVKSVQRERERIMKLGKTQKGYLIATLSKNNKKISYYVHRLVAAAFISNSDNLPQVDHCDNDKTNNKVENLRFVNNSTNHRNILKLRSDNISNIQGISFCNSGNGWTASWCEDKQKKKSFSTLKYGDQAKQMAIEYRNQKVTQHYNRPVLS